MSADVIKRRAEASESTWKVLRTPVFPFLLFRFSPFPGLAPSFKGFADLSKNNDKVDGYLDSRKYYVRDP